MNHLAPVREGILMDVHNGKRIKVEDIANEIQENYGVEPLQAYRSARSLIQRVKHYFARKNVPFVRLPDGTYGIPKTKEEVRMVMEGFKHSIESNLSYALITKQYASNHNLLPLTYKEETIKLPSFTSSRI